MNTYDCIAGPVVRPDRPGQRAVPCPEAAAMRDHARRRDRTTAHRHHRTALPGGAGEAPRLRAAGLTAHRRRTITQSASREDS